MSASFLLALDTQTHVEASINGGAPTTELTTVTLGLEVDADVIEAKIWGDINPLDPANADYAETEAEASWIPISPSFLVNLTTNPGAKNLSVRVRDDVWNEATDSDTIVLGQEEVPTPRPTQRPKPVPGKPTPAPEPELREVRTSSRGVALTSSATVSISTVSQGRGVTLQVSPGLIQSRAAGVTGGFQLATSVQSYIKTDVKRPTAVVLGSEPAAIGKADDPDLLALLLDL